MMDWKRAVLAVVAIGSATACSLIGNLDQFNGAVEAEAGSTGLVDARASDRSIADALPDGVERGDALKGGADASVSDGGADGSPPDGGDSGSSDGSDGGDDGALDGGDGGDAAVDWCLANATPDTTFCRDFDDGKPYAYGFAAYLALADGGEAPSVVSTDFVSPPNSMLVPTPALASGSESEQVQLVVHISDHTRIQLQFALKLVDYDVSVGDLSLVRIAFDSGNWWVSWDLQGNANVYETIVSPDGGQTLVTHPTTMPALGQWVNVVLTVDVDAETVALTLNGAPALQDSISAPALVGSLSVTIGINYLQGPATPMSLYYDNVAIVTN
jgi:hypothetical protein